MSQAKQKIKIQAKTSKTCVRILVEKQFDGGEKFYAYLNNFSRYLATMSTSIFTLFPVFKFPRFVCVRV